MTKDIKKHLLLWCLLIGALVNTGLCQEHSPFFTEGELGHGFRLKENVTTIKEEITSQLSTRQKWRTDDNLAEISLEFGVYHDPETLLAQWRLLNRTNLPGQVTSEEPQYGDAYASTLPSTPTHFRLLKNHTIISCVLNLDEKLTDEESEELFERLRVLAAEKAQALDPVTTVPFEAELQRVETASGPDFIIEVNSNPFPPIYFQYSVTPLDGDEVLLSEKNADLQSPYVISTSSLATGRYFLLVVVSDELLRSKTLYHEFDIVEVSKNTRLNVARDTAFQARNPHQNEGANPLLTLEKVQGKAARNAVAFELAALNLTGLSRATLVLTIDPSQAVNGWGNGRTISAQAITTPCQEGNGWSFGLKKKDQIAGNGSGATWFSPADQDISNDSANSAVNWDGATSSVYPPTAPSVQIANFQSGEVAFDVTTDVLNGAENGWLVLKDQENVGSKVSFYSREGAAAAGNPDLAPRLILEFGDPVASAAPSNGLLAEIGLGSIGTKFRTTRNGSELRPVREILQDSPVAALAAEQMLCEAARTNPVLNLTARTAYRSWLAEDLQVATVPRWAV